MIDATALKNEEVNLSNNAILIRTATSRFINGEYHSTNVIQLQGDKLAFKKRRPSVRSMFFTKATWKRKEV